MTDNHQPRLEPGVDIGHLHLKVADLDRAVAFYRDVLGFTVQGRLADAAGFLSAGGYHHHIGLTTFESRGANDALYLTDPDGNGLELSWDRPHHEWPRTAEERLALIDLPLDLDSLLELAPADDTPQCAPPR